MKLSASIISFYLSLVAVCAFHLHGSSTLIKRLPISRLFSSNDADPYGYDELLDFDKPLKQEMNPAAITENSIVVGSDFNVSSANVMFRNKGTETRKAKPNSMEEYLEQQFGELDAALKGDEQWVTELRDIVELKRGFAVWSKRSDKEIKKEAKKALASKGVNIPNNVALAINTVFIEKSCSMAVFKKEQEMVYADYKKWIREQKQKLKKDPLPSVKGELVKKWLMRPQGTKLTSFPSNSRGKQAAPGLYFRKRPSVVLDELSTVLEDLDRGNTASVATDLNADENSAPTMVVNNAVKTAGTTPSAVLSAVASIQNWNRSAAEMSALEGTASSDGEYEVISNNLSRRRNALSARKPAPSYEYMVDDVPMYIPNALSDEFFVVL